MVVFALIANLAIAIVKFFAAAFTGSSAMMAEAVHSMADTTNQALLLLGIFLAKRPADENYSMGRGREPFFWGFVVSVLLFGLGGTFSIAGGLDAWANPGELHSLGPALAVLAVALVLEGWAWRAAWREFNRGRGDRPLLQAARDSKDSATLVVLFEDSAAMAGLVIAGVGLGMAAATGDPRWDAGASIAVGVVLGVVALFLGIETRGLLIGESASPAVREAIEKCAVRSPEVVQVHDVVTQQTGPAEVMIGLHVEFRDGLVTDEVEGAVERLESALRTAVPEAGHVFIEPFSSSRPRHAKRLVRRRMRRPGRP